ncbi:M23 family metallopeptidase [Spirochaeta africana]|nr:M23 family metallopeptidase [Spirochaeta africana]
MQRCLALTVLILLIGIPASPLNELPVLQSLQETDPLFRQIRSDIEQSYRVGTPSPPLLLFRYYPAEHENIFSIASRLLLPYSTLATLNGITSATASLSGTSLLIPNQPGIFSADPQRDAREDPTELAALDRPWFYPGQDFTPAERRRFFEQRFSFPVASPRVTSGYGMRSSPITGRPLMHNGVDFGGRPNSEVLAAADGEIIEVAWTPVLGFYVKIQHDENLSSVYGHLSQIEVSYGQQVRRSERIGRMGTTGLTTGPHVHFEIHHHGVPVDPFRYLPGINSP